MSRLLLFAALLLTGTAASGETADWRYSVGVHDFAVPDVDSDTYGINGSVSVDKRTEAGRHVYGSAVVYVDRDKDDLDPDHIPIWWQLHAGTDGDFRQGDRARLGWNANVDTRMNTVSSVEREILAMPALVASYDTNAFRASAQASAGWFFLEIDDDVPKSRGYVREERGDFRNNALAYSLAADLSLRLGSSSRLTARRRSGGTVTTGWRLITRWHCSMAAGQSHEQSSEFVLSADFNEYNLDPYFRPNVGVPILPWDNDVMIRLSFDTAWKR